MTQFKMEEKKYTNALLYFLKYCNNKYLGAVKLNKLLYYLDFISYRDRKKIVTGDIYIHQKFGPIPEKVDLILSNLQQKNKIKTNRVVYNGGDTFEYNPLVDPDISVFDKYENTLLENICKEFILWNTEKIVNQTHLEAPWFYSKPYEKVDFDYAKDIEFFVA